MRLEVRLYAGLAERAGRRELVIDGVPDGLSVAQAKAHIAARFPALGPLEHVRGVLGTRYAAEETAVLVGDVLHLLPPVSGGARGAGGAEPADSEPGDSEPGDSEPADSEPADSEPGDSEPGDSEPADSEPADSEPADSEPADSEPADSEPADSERGDSEPGDSERGDSERGVFELQSGPLDPGLAWRRVAAPSCGAVVVFSGHTREHNRDQRVVRLEYEAFGAMAGPEMGRIFAEALERFGPASASAGTDGAARRLRMLAIHRTGVVDVGEASVLVAVASPHRASAFDACEFLIDVLKERLPVWKKEIYTSGAVWIGERS